MNRLLVVVCALVSIVAFVIGSFESGRKEERARLKNDPLALQLFVSEIIKEKIEARKNIEMELGILKGIPTVSQPADSIPAQ